MASLPVFHKPLNDISTSQGECLVLECRVKGNPFPDVVWRREGYLIGNCPGFEMLHKGEVNYSYCTIDAGPDLDNKRP